MFINSASISALHALQKAQQNSAHNVANLATPGFAPTQTVFQPVESGGVRLELQQPRPPLSDDDLINEEVENEFQPSGTDLAQESVNQLIYRRSAQANIAVIKTQDGMLGDVIDILA